jgi:hypothetical protein
MRKLPLGTDWKEAIMKAKTLAALSTAVFLSMSVVAHSEECKEKFWLQWPNGETCAPWGFGWLHGGTVNLYNGLWHIGSFGTIGATATCAYLHRPARFCGRLAKSLK